MEPGPAVCGLSSHAVQSARGLTASRPGGWWGGRTSAPVRPNAGWVKLQAEINQRVQAAQVRVAVNREVLTLPWQTGRGILRRQREEGWGPKVIDRPEADLHAAFSSLGRRS